MGRRVRVAVRPSRKARPRLNDLHGHVSVRGAAGAKQQSPRTPSCRRLPMAALAMWCSLRPAMPDDIFEYNDRGSGGGAAEGGAA